MLDDATLPLAALRISPRQRFFWTDAALVFNWCEQQLRPSVEKLDAPARKVFADGGIPKQLLDAVRVALSSELMECWPPEGTCAVAAKVLKNPRDLAAWKTCLNGQQHKLPKRIRTTVFNALRERCEEIHEAFFANVSDTLLAEYCRAWQSMEQAQLRLIVKARGESIDPKGKLTFGPLRLNARKYALRTIRTRKRTDDRGIPEQIYQAARENDTRFFIRLGKVLQSRRTLVEVDWCLCSDISRMLVDNWCGWHWAVGFGLPPLCLFSAQAIADFCSVAFGRNQGTPSLDATWKLLSRLGLKQASHPTICSLDQPSLKKGELLFIPRTPLG